MYPAEEWLIIAFVCSGTFAFLSGKRLVAGRIRGDAYFWVIVGPVLTFFGVLAFARKYKYWSEKVIKIVNAFFNGTINALGVGLTQLLIALFVFALGVGAYFFKKKNQTWYGNVELLVGFLTALFVAGTLTAGTLELSKCATLAGSAYIIARGIGNRDEGKNRAVHGESS